MQYVNLKFFPEPTNDNKAEPVVLSEPVIQSAEYG